MKTRIPFTVLLFLQLAIAASAQFNRPPFGRTAAPADNDSCQAASVQLCVQARDPDGDSMLVRFYFRPSLSAPRDFTLVGLPDTQFYTSAVNGGTPSMFRDQTSWIVTQKDSLNIAHVMQFGDCTNYGDNAPTDYEWRNADTAMKIIEDPSTTSLAEGISYSMNVGNHDQMPMGDANGTTTYFNQYFGTARFTGRSYWGGNYGSNADNSFQLFSASGYDFIVISLEFDQFANPLVLQWADSLVQAYPARKAIIVSHYLLNLDGTFGAQGQAIYNALKHNPNLFLMLCGHMHGEARRTDVYNGDTVHTLLSDYQAVQNGGNGWLRVMTFSPELNTLSVRTYSPTLQQYENDTNSRFILPVQLFPQQPFTCFDSAWIDSAGTACVTLNNLALNSGYDWYATIADDSSVSTTGFSRFATFGPAVDLTAAMDTVCMYGSPVPLSGIPAGGVYSGNNALAGFFDPAQLLQGTYPVYYTYVAQNGCPGFDSLSITVIPCSGIAEQASPEFLVHYAAGMLRVDQLSAPGRIFIYDLRGRMLLEADCSNGTNTIRSPQLNAGFYLYRLIYDDGRSVSGRFQVQE